MTPTATKPADPKMADAKAGGMPEMKPPQELVDMAQAATGTWKCKGPGMDHTMKLTGVAGTMKPKIDLDRKSRGEGKGGNAGGVVHVCHLDLCLAAVECASVYYGLFLFCALLKSDRRA